MFGLEIGNLKDVLTRNPLKYGDALGLTYGPLSGRAPGKLTSTGLDLQQKVNPLVSRKDLENSNDLAPYVAAAIATFGGSAAGEAPALGEEAGGGLVGGEGGAFDMYGSQSSPTDASTVFDGPRGAPSQPAWQRLMRSQTGGLGGRSGGADYTQPQQQYQPQAVQPNSYAQNAMQDAQPFDDGTLRYWLDRADKLHMLAGHVSSQLYGART